MPTSTKLSRPSAPAESSLAVLSDYFRLCGKTFGWIARGPFQKGAVRVDATFEEMILIGVNALPVVGLASMFMGVVLAMQGAYQLKQLGATEWVADLVSVSMFREIGPLITGIIVIGRSGSAVAAALGTMKVSEEVDALEVMGIDPVRYLVVPSFLSMCIMVPCLTVLGECLGLFGGWLLAKLSLHLDTFQFITRMLHALTLRDVWSGLLKSVVFGGLIGSIACFYGLRVQDGAEGVGRNTTLSVVTGMTAVLGADCCLTAIFYFL